MKIRLKKRFLFFLAAVLVIFLVIYIWPFVFRHHYTEEDRPIYYDPLGNHHGCYAGIPDPPINDLTSSADLIFTGTVLSGGKEVLKVIPFVETMFGEETANYNIFHRTAFTVKVNEVWFGECREKIIKVYLPAVVRNDVPRPSRGDRIVFFSSLAENRMHGEYYHIDDESGLFVIDPSDNSIFALDTSLRFTEFDGYSPGAFRETVALYWKGD